MSIILEAPFQNFTGLDGKPLTNGKVYIGQVGTDPTVTANQIPIFWDSALTIPAAQPLQTSAGYIVRTGSPARVYLNSDYSISVLNANNVLVYYVQSFGTIDFVRYDALAATSGATLIGTTDGITVQSFINRSPSKLGRISAGDLPKFMETIRGYRQDLQQPIYEVGFGSSVGNAATVPNPSLNAPVAWFHSQMKAQFDPGNLYNLQFLNYSVDGSSASEFPTAWAAMLAAGITPKIVHFAYGMNDAGVALYNSGQTFPGFYNAMRAAILTAKKIGADVVICTSPHPSIVLNPSMYAMPAGVPQIYPTSVAAPVAPESLLPPASQSKIVADFVTEGTAISVDHRMLRINQAMRNLAREFGCTLIDAERGWFEALQKYQIQTGTPGGAEGLLFNPGETVHPNLLGHQVSYQRETNDFISAFSKPISQPNVDPKLNGYYAINFDGGTPGAVLDVRAPYTDLTTKTISFKAPIGTPDANGIPAQVEFIHMDPSNGDLVQGGGGWKLRTTLGLGGARNGIDFLGSSTGVNVRERIQGDVNNSSTYNIALPDNMAGELIVSSQNNGIGTSPHVKFYRWFSKSGVLTLAANGSDIGSLVINVSTSGLNVVVTPISANTNLQANWKAIGP